MARETKAQRWAREHAEMKALDEIEVRTYPERLMCVMQRACQSNFELQVVDGQFFLYDRDKRQREEFWLTVDHNCDSEEVLQTLTFEVNYKLTEQEKANRKFHLKQAALAKLSDEERELLGLK